MKARIQYFVCVLCLLLLSPVTAQFNRSLESGVYRIDYIHMGVDETGFVDVEKKIVVDKPTVDLFVPSDASNLRIFDSAGDLSHTYTLSEEGKVITFSPRSHFPESDEKIHVGYTTQHITSKNGSIWTLKFSTPANPTLTKIVIDFPLDSNVFALRPNDVLRHPPDLSSPLELYPQKTDFYFEVDYQTGQGSPAEDYGYVFLAAVFIILVLAGVYLKLIKGRGVQEKGAEDAEGVKKEIKPSIVNILGEREKEIIRILEESDGEISQAYIYKTTGIPKATLSNLIQGLEGRNIIESRRDGRIKWIELKEWVFE